MTSTAAEETDTDQLKTEVVQQDQGEDEEVLGKFLFTKYLVATLLANGAVCAVTVMLWSLMGFGDNVYSFLEDCYWLSIPAIAVAFVIMFVLYLLDFFWPPHLPGHVLRLWETDFYVGKSALGIAGVLAVVACLLRAKDFPSVPLIIAILFCPLCVYLAHIPLHPTIEMPKDESGNTMRKSQIVSSGDTHAKIMLLKSITGEETNITAFLKASMATFMITFGGMLLVWVVWVLVSDTGSIENIRAISTNATLSTGEKDRLYVQWATPLVVSVSNFVFGLFATLRIFMERAYVRTDVYKNRIIADCMKSTMIQEMTAHRLELLKKARNTRIFDFEQGEALEKKRQQYLEQHAGQAKQVSTVIKIVGCVFILLLGCLYVANQLFYANTHIASMVIATMASFFFVFVIFIYISFRRVVSAMGKWLMELPAWKTIKMVMENTWCTAIVLGPFIVLLPVIVLASLVNQKVRLWRGLYNRLQRPPSENSQIQRTTESSESTIPQDTLRLTPRVYNRLVVMKEWDWLSIITKLYILCFVYMAVTLVPPLLNVVLAWLNDYFDRAGWHFSVIVISTFFIGVVAFLLPPVPGMTVYLFGGLVISGNCPPKGTDQGFWTGAVVNIIMCWFLKLAACAVQQVGIGGLLGKSMWVRRTAGIHRVGIRCIERILKEKGYTVGKVAILCGGPDWPTSVLAGVLGLPLLEMELGTLPIILFIAPTALCGSLYLRKGESELYNNSANLMLAFSLMVSLVLWAVAAWAMQQQLEQHHDELTTPKSEHVDLEWLDYRTAQMKSRLTIKWRDVPKLLRALLASGVVVHVLVCHALTWQYSALIGSFQVSDDINDLVFFTAWDTSEGLFTIPAVVIIVLYCLTWLCYIAYNYWLGRVTQEVYAAAAKELDPTEATWKENFLKTCTQKEAALAARDNSKEQDGSTLATVAEADENKELNTSAV